MKGKKRHGKGRDADIHPQGETLTSSESEKTSLGALADAAARGRVTVEIPAQMTAPIVTQTEKVGNNISLLDIIVWVWGSGSLIFVSVHLISYFHCKRQVLKKGRGVKDREVLCLLLKLKRELHIKCTVPVIEYSEAASPMMIGFLNPILVLPEVQYNSTELFFILKHELIHLKRGDIYFKLLFVAANAVHWFNPLIWIMQKEATVDMELSCDERVTQDADYAARKAYTETLLSAFHKQSAKKTVLSTGFYGGKQIMKQRFKNILAKKGKKNGVAVLICAIILAVSLGTLVGCSITKENIEEESGPLGAEDIPVESIQTNEPSLPPNNYSFETEPSNSDYSTGTEDDLIFANPIFLEDYYNTPDGKAAIESDFADLAGEGMSVTVFVIMDEIVVTVKYEDSALLSEDIKETLAQQLDSMTDRFWRWTIAYDEFITWRCVLTVRYTDSEGNVLAEQSYSAE